MGKNCPTCGARTVRYRFRLNKGLATALAELYRASLGSQGRPTQLGSLPISKAQYSNFPKLRYWDLAQSDARGKWAITPNGVAFVEGRGFARPVAHTDRGCVVERTGEPVTINDFLPGYDWSKFYVSTAEPKP